MKLFNLALIASFNDATNIRDAKKSTLSRRSVFIERDHLNCSHDRDYLVPGEQPKSIQSSDFMNFDNFNKHDRYCRWALHTTKGAHIMLDFDVLHVPCGHNNAHGFYIEEDGQTSVPVCGRRRTYRKYYSTSNKLTLTFYAPKEGARFQIHYQSVHDVPDDSVTIEHVNRDVHSPDSLEKMGIFVTDQPMISQAHFVPSIGSVSSSSSSSMYTSSMPRSPQNGRIHLRNGMTQNLYGLNQAGTQAPQTNVLDSRGNLILDTKSDAANDELSFFESLWRENWVKTAVIIVGGVVLAIVIALVYYCKVYDNTKKRSRHQSESRGEPRVHRFSS